MNPESNSISPGPSDPEKPKKTSPALPIFISITIIVIGAALMWFIIWSSSHRSFLSQSQFKQGDIVSISYSCSPIVDVQNGSVVPATLEQGERYYLQVYPDDYELFKQGETCRLYFGKSKQTPRTLWRLLQSVKGINSGTAVSGDQNDSYLLGYGNRYYLAAADPEAPKDRVMVVFCDNYNDWNGIIYCYSGSNYRSTQLPGYPNDVVPAFYFWRNGAGNTYQMWCPPNGVINFKNESQEGNCNAAILKAGFGTGEGITGVSNLTFPDPGNYYGQIIGSKFSSRPVQLPVQNATPDLLFQIDKVLL